MIHPHPRTARLLSSSASLVAALALAGCDVFDPSLYKNAGGSGADLSMTQDLSGDDLSGLDLAGGAGSMVDMLSPIDPDAGNVLCGRSTPATLCPGGYLFCDGFESESGRTFPSWTMPIIQGAGTNVHIGTDLVVADSPTCLGQSSMHATTVGANQQAFVYTDLAAPVPTTLHVRFFFYMKQYSMTPFQIVGFHSTSNDPNGYATLNVDPINGALNYANGFGAMSGANFNHANLPVNQWICLELTETFSATSGNVQLQLDGTKIGDTTIPTQPVGETLDQVNVGIIYTNTGDSGNNDVYFDEVAISANPIGCL
jgi:hypothetical protein